MLLEVVRVRNGETTGAYRGTSLIRNHLRLGPYSRTMPRALWGPWGRLRFLASEVALHTLCVSRERGASLHA